MFYYVTMLFNLFKTHQALALNISFETLGDQRSATVIYSSSTRHKKSTSEREVMNFFNWWKTKTEIYLLSNGIRKPYKQTK